MLNILGYMHIYNVHINVCCLSYYYSWSGTSKIDSVYWLMLIPTEDPFASVSARSWFAFDNDPNYIGQYRRFSTEIECQEYCNSKNMRMMIVQFIRLLLKRILFLSFNFFRSFIRGSNKWSTRLVIIEEILSAIDSFGNDWMDELTKFEKEQIIEQLIEEVKEYNNYDGC